jgi:hypothetical protein
MESESFKLHLATALKNHDMRRACTAVEHVLRAADILDELPPAALEAIRDYCDDYIKGRKGLFSDFKRAYIELVVDHLRNMRICERRLFHGITGQDGPEETGKRHLLKEPSLVG